jgi:NhaA family Na+:H+ antiporter
MLRDSHYLPTARIDRWLSPVHRFMAIKASSGILLIVCTAVALIWANSAWAESYFALWHTPLTIGVGSWVLTKDLLHFVNDGLMVLFFFVVGLEIKREIVGGELRDLQKAALPIVAALGGMVVPAAVYVALGFPLQLPAEAARGWAIPMATDIAFVVGVLALFGSRVPFGLKILLLSLAIVDDLGAVLIIAFVFTSGLAWLPLAVATAGCLLTWFMNWAGVRSIAAYAVVGVIVWFGVLKSGVHPTVAGVILGLMTPCHVWVPVPSMVAVVESLHRELSTKGADDPDLNHTIHEAEFALRESSSPLQRLEHTLHPWVAFVIMPVFALANAGVAIRLDAALEPTSLCVAAGLFLGKPLGIMLFSAVAVQMGLAKLPTGVNWMLLLGGSCLAGIGFTMSLFLVTLALPGSFADAGKLGTLIGSAASMIVGSAIILLVSKPAQPDSES